MTPIKCDGNCLPNVILHCGGNRTVQVCRFRARQIHTFTRSLQEPACKLSGTYTASFNSTSIQEKG